MGRKISTAFHPSVVDYLDDLTFTLYKKGYFGFIDSATDYTDEMIDFIDKNIHSRAHKKAPAYFDKFGKICITLHTSQITRLLGTSSLLKMAIGT